MVFKSAFRLLTLKFRLAELLRRSVCCGASSQRSILLFWIQLYGLGAEAFDSCDSSQIIEFNFIAHGGVVKTGFVQQQVNFSGRGYEGRNAIVENGVCSSTGRCAAIVAFL